MAKMSSKNNDLLYAAKDRTSQKIYSMLVKLVNGDREDLAQSVLKIDYLLEYTSNCIKQKDFKEAKETIERANERINNLKKENIDVSHLEYLYGGIRKKCK